MKNKIKHPFSCIVINRARLLKNTKENGKVEEYGIFSTGTCFKGICSIGMDLATRRRHLFSPSSGVALFGFSHEVMLDALCLSSFLFRRRLTSTHRGAGSAWSRRRDP